MIIKSLYKDYGVNVYADMSPLSKLVYDNNTFVVIDKTVYDLYQELFNDIPEGHVDIVEAIEENKVIETSLEICEKMTSLSAKRNTKLISFGGGIIQDITGFVANVLYRGISWIFIPTTLLAGCDSCIGGKTSLNYKRFKNLLGTFYPPDQIHICTPFFKTLSDKDYKSGLGEVVKFNIMRGESGIRSMEDNIGHLLNRDDDILVQYVNSSLSFKKRFIEEDEFDKGERIKLNFAHTFGHAIETVSGYDIPHGTAVAMGTIVANSISYGRGWIAGTIMDRVEDVLKKIIDAEIQKYDFSENSLMPAIRKDKKQIGESLTAVLLRGQDFSLEVVHDVEVKEIEDGFKHLVKVIG